MLIKIVFENCTVYIKLILFKLSCIIPVLHVALNISYDVSTCKYYTLYSLLKSRKTETGHSQSYLSPAMKK